MESYDHKSIESKWQKIWEECRPFGAEFPSDKKKCYLLIEFPYPSGEGLHIGHPRSYCSLDVVARKRRMEGYNVLYPIGWDAFGLPTENYAIKVGRPPQEISQENIANFRCQLKALGISFDWDREVDTTDPKYYKWTQWIFLQLFKHGLAYKDNVPINWCPKCKIGLANEEVVQGSCERCGTPTEKRQKEQWMLAITKYADRLIDDLEKVDYLEKIKIQQRNWIGRSEGALVRFNIRCSRERNWTEYLEVFTTRPDTLFGVTFMVVAPEHPLIKKGEEIIENYAEVIQYVEEAKKKTDIERSAETREKTGLKIEGVSAINPVNGQEIPIYVADYVMVNYGTGAIMAVPAHDHRDFAFARKFGIEIRKVVEADPSNSGDALDSSNFLTRAYEGEGVNINSGFLNGLRTQEAREKIVSWLEEKNLGKRSISYKLRDWVFSRQHYWGEPIPIVYCANCLELTIKKRKITDLRYGVDYVEIKGQRYAVVTVPEDQLPVELPVVEKYQPTDTGESPLAAITDWVNTKCPVCGSDAIRETDTMPNWAGSSWYFLRYVDPKNDQVFADRQKLDYWLPVDLYNGGMEHTTLHLLYSRFWHKFLFDIGLVPTEEPYQRRVSHGLILAEDGQKMSKSKGNVVNPDEMVEKYGADAFRLYEMFIGPFDQVVKWQSDGIRGTRRFLEKVWHLAEKVSTTDSQSEQQSSQESAINKLILTISHDIDHLQFNTAVSSLMEFVNFLGKQSQISLSVWQNFLKILSPLAPHITEELWQRINPERLICQELWPTVVESKITKDDKLVVVQVNGKVRGSLKLYEGIAQEEAVFQARQIPNVRKYLDNKEILKTIYIPGKIISFYVKNEG